MKSYVSISIYLTNKKLPLKVVFDTDSSAMNVMSEIASSYTQFVKIGELVIARHCIQYAIMSKSKKDLENVSK